MYLFHGSKLNGLKELVPSPNSTYLYATRDLRLAASFLLGADHFCCACLYSIFYTIVSRSLYRTNDSSGSIYVLDWTGFQPTSGDVSNSFEWISTEKQIPIRSFSFFSPRKVLKRLQVKLFVVGDDFYRTYVAEGAGGSDVKSVIEMMVRDYACEEL